MGSWKSEWSIHCMSIKQGPDLSVCDCWKRLHIGGWSESCSSSNHKRTAKRATPQFSDWAGMSWIGHPNFLTVSFFTLIYVGVLTDLADLVQVSGRQSQCWRVDWLDLVQMLGRQLQLLSLGVLGLCYVQKTLLHSSPPWLPIFLPLFLNVP